MSSEAAVVERKADASEQENVSADESSANHFNEFDQLREEIAQLHGEAAAVHEAAVAANKAVRVKKAKAVVAKKAENLRRKEVKNKTARIDCCTSSEDPWLKLGEILTLYHQTDPIAADVIQSSGRMLRGRNGLAGGGIYFAVTPEETNGKAQRHGCIIACEVRLGKVLTLGPSGNRDITHYKLKKMGYDSVKILRPGGIEHVVYSYEQVRIQGKKWGGQGCIGHCVWCQTMYLWNGGNSAHAAASAGHQHCLEALGKDHQLLGSVDNAGWTPAHHAALNGHVHCLQTLAALGAINTFSVETRSGNTPSDFAKEEERKDCVEYLDQMRT